MAEAVAEDEVLTPDDAINVTEELLPAQNESYNIGLKLNLLHHEVEAIQSTYPRPPDFLLHIIIRFLERTEPRPTWRVIVGALRSPSVKQQALAKRVEEAHFLNLPVTREPPSTGTGPTVSTTTHRELSSSILTSALQSQMNEFGGRFNTIKVATIKCLIACQITVASMVFWLTSIRALDKHKVFLEENLEVLGQCTSHWLLFGKLNFYWNYLACDLLYQLVEVLTMQYEAFRTISQDMAAYKRDLEGFRRTTSLKMFCEAQILPFLSQEALPPGFREMVVRFNWSETVTLEEIERFRIRYCQVYRLEQCAMMVNRIRPGSFVVTWFIPVSVVKAVCQQGESARDLFVKFHVTRLEIAGRCIYQSSEVPKRKPPAERKVYHLPVETSSAERCAKRMHWKSPTKRFAIQGHVVQHKGQKSLPRSAFLQAGEYLVQHRQEIAQLLERYKTVEYFYALEPQANIPKPGDEKSERAVARERYEELVRRQRLVSVGVTAAAVAGGAVGAVIFGVAGLVVSAAVAGGLWYKIRGGRQIRSDADKAQEEVERLELTNKIRIGKIMLFMRDFEKFSEEYTENFDISVAEELEAYCLYDSQGTEIVLPSFQEALTVFIAMNKKGEHYVFKIPFRCAHCKDLHLEFPYVSSSQQQVCAKCYGDLQS